MVFLTLTSVAPLLTARMKASLPPMITRPPPCSVALDKPTSSAPDRTAGSISMAPELLIVPLIVSVAPSLTFTSELPAMVTPLIVFVVPNRASITAPFPVVLSVPPETTAPFRSTWAPEPEARIEPAPILVTVPSIVTLAPLPSAPMIFELATLLSMARPTEVRSLERSRIDDDAARRGYGQRYEECAVAVDHALGAVDELKQTGAMLLPMTPCPGSCCPRSARPSWSRC
jgi:hypothetical protein